MLQILFNSFVSFSTTQLLLGLQSFRFMLLLLLDRLLKGANLDINISVSIIIGIIGFSFYYFHFLLLLLMLLLLFTAITAIVEGSWFFRVQAHHCNFTTSLYRMLLYSYWDNFDS